ncbi:uncharacterized protein LOC133366021 [Rhineura floridana]|uniref:uncharacterized protein LOC133366021 n=1 Tax=Rhineura floridana TaxID=261503 RepID=UPI002AC87C58|nr:uncharacterized protein LOC133366021 [Rhineura floridana]XP_061444627.1 uncharacterized protein LOC133366021 [Rhineura floridana]
METEEHITYKPYNATPYYCNICKVYCASPVNLQTHFLGMKHKAVEEALKSHGIVKPLSDAGEPIKPPESLPDYIQTEPEKVSGKTLEEQLNSCKATEPAIGLQYITEYQSKENPVYECNLCGCQSGLANMFMHVLGVKHKLAYLRRHYPYMAILKGRGSNLNKRLRLIAAKIERDEGRKQIMVSVDNFLGKDDRYSVEPSDSLVTWFSEDDPAKENKKEKELEEKEDTKKAEHTSKNAERCDDHNKSKDEEQSQNTVALKNVELTDSDSEEFHSNEELLKYLQYFEIVNEDDASFILKVTQKLTNSLVAYRQKISEKKNFSESNPNERTDDQLECSKATSVKIDELITGLSEKQPPVQLSSEDKETNLNVKPSFKRKSSQLNENDSIKSHKLGTFVPTFKEVPSKQTSPDAETEHPLSAEECLPNLISDKNAFSQYQTETPSTSLAGSFKSDSHVIAEFFNSIRNMDVDEVAATLHKIVASNPSFSGMDVQNVIKILTQSGNLKSKKTTSTSSK